MWHGKQASPASSTSTVDQQEIIFEESQSHQQQPSIYELQQSAIDSTFTQATSLPSNRLVSISTSDNDNTSVIPTNSNVLIATATSTTTTPATTRRQTNSSTTRATKRPRNTNSQYARVNGSNSTNKATTNSNTTVNSKCSPLKRPKLYNLPQQLAPWKSLQHHFLRHTDVKYRPEKRMTMAELENEVLQRRKGWKVHHLVGQLTDLIQNEHQTRQKITSLLELFTDTGAKRIHDLADNCHKLPEQYAALLQSQRSYGKNEFKPELIVTKLDDLLRGDLQRSNMFDEQLKDCRDIIVRITNEHRDRVARITTKFNKRIQL